MYEEIFDTQEIEGEEELLGFEGEEEFDAHEFGGTQEDRETELAAELLSVADENELDRFLGKFLRGIAKTPGGQKLKGLLRATAANAIPFGGAAIGRFLGGDRGAAFGSQVGAAASQLFGLETEGLSPEDRELQIARRFVRLASDAAQRLGVTGGEPAAAARQALLGAAQRHAPGLASRMRGGSFTVIDHRTPPVNSRKRTKGEPAMHDLDRTLRSQESESNYESDEIFGDSEGDFEEEISGEITEQEELDLAAELLTVSNDRELDQFLGGVFKKLKGAIVPALTNYIKPLAKKLIPLAATAAGGFFGGPVGAKIGGKLGSLATNLFEVDFESMDPETQDFEVAKSFVRFASAAAKNAATSADSGGDPRKIAKNAIVRAARSHAPGLLADRGVGTGSGSAGAGIPTGVRRCRPQTGRWIRRSGRIVLLGV